VEIIKFSGKSLLSKAPFTQRLEIHEWQLLKQRKPQLTRVPGLVRQIADEASCDTSTKHF
jgi:hypothetical protein